MTISHVVDDWSTGAAAADQPANHLTAWGLHLQEQGLAEPNVLHMYTMDQQIGEEIIERNEWI